MSIWLSGLKRFPLTLPWYVGRTIKQDFGRECFAYHKLHKLNEVLDEHPGTLVLYLVASTGADAGAS